MKKKALISLLLLLSLLCCLTVSVHAEARLDYVNDYAGLLSDYERQSLSEEAAQLSEQYDCGVYIVIVGDYREFVNGNIETFTEEVFHSYGLGRGESENGVILGMSMDDRDYDIYAHGDFGNYAFTDYGKEQLADSFLDNFRRNDWAGGFRDFVENSGELMRRARNGEPLDQWISDEPEEHFGVIELFICLFVGLITGGATVSGMKKQMKTAVEQTRASGYVPKGGVNLRVQSDQFVNRIVTSHRIRREQNRSGGHYRGTTISGSHGGSHHSGKF